MSSKNTIQKTPEEIALEEAWKLRMASRQVSRDKRKGADGRILPADQERIKSQKIYDDLSGVYDRKNFH